MNKAGNMEQEALQRGIMCMAEAYLGRCFSRRDAERVGRAETGDECKVGQEPALILACNSMYLR